MNFDDIKELFMTCLSMTEFDLKFCFAMCKMAVTDEAKSYTQYFNLLWPEFLEFIGRVAEQKFKDSD